MEGGAYSSDTSCLLARDIYRADIVPQHHSPTDEYSCPAEIADRHLGVSPRSRYPESGVCRGYDTGKS
jgi:hypothetical protein